MNTQRLHTPHWFKGNTNNMFFGTLIEAGGTAPSWYVDNFT